MEINTKFKPNPDYRLASVLCRKARFFGCAKIYRLLITFVGNGIPTYILFHRKLLGYLVIHFAQVRFVSRTT
jgi:hypothetical protein